MGNGENTSTKLLKAYKLSEPKGLFRKVLFKIEPLYIKQEEIIMTSAWRQVFEKYEEKEDEEENEIMRNPESMEKVKRKMFRFMCYSFVLDILACCSGLIWNNLVVMILLLVLSIGAAFYIIWLMNSYTNQTEFSGSQRDTARKDAWDEIITEHLKMITKEDTISIDQKREFIYLMLRYKKEPYSVVIIRAIIAVAIAVLSIFGPSFDLDKDGGVVFFLVLAFSLLVGFLPSLFSKLYFLKRQLKFDDMVSLYYSREKDKKDEKSSSIGKT